MLNIIIIISLLNTTLLHCAKKWGWIDLLQAHGFKICYMCLGFWLAVAEFILVLNITPELLEAEKYVFWVFLTPFCSAAITNWLVNAAIINDKR